MDNELKIKVIRYEEKETRTHGKMYINGEYFCDTLEDKDRRLEDFIDNPDLGKTKKVYSKTAIPLGRYNAKKYYWQKYQRYYLWIMNVPFFSGIMVHGGVTEADSAGCILIGKRCGERLAASSVYVGELRKKIMMPTTITVEVVRELESEK